MNMIECPCVDCVCLAICRHKTVGTLLVECAILDKSIDKYIKSLKIGEIINHWPSIESALNPTAWYLDERNNIYSR